MFDYIRKIFDHNRFTILALVPCVLIGCTLLQPTTEGPLSGKRVTRIQLDAEVEQIIAKAQGAYADLESKEAIRTQIFSVIGQLTQTIPTPYSGALTAILGIFAAGATTDNVRKNRIVAQYKAQRDAAMSNGTATQ